MLLPRMDNESSVVGSRLRAVILTVFRCVFICMSTPARSAHRWSGDRERREGSASNTRAERGVRTCDGAVHDGPVFQLDGHRLIVQLHQKSVRESESVRTSMMPRAEQSRRKRSRACCGA